MKIEKCSILNSTGEIQHEAGVKLTNRIKRATQLHCLNNVAGEPFQIANYGIGGTYSQHWDSTGEFGKPFSGLPTSDIRIATSMVYLSDVKAGGATVFPKAGVTIWPKKGNLAFW